MTIFQEMPTRRTGAIFVKRCPDLVCDNHFSALNIAISMIQQHFIKLTLNVSKYVYL